MAKIRSMLAPYLKAPQRVDFGAALWGALDTNERAFLCRLARMDGSARKVDWRELPDDFRDAIVRAWRDHCAFVRRVELAIEKAGRR